MCASIPSCELNMTKREAEFGCFHGPKERGQESFTLLPFLGQS